MNSARHSLLVEENQLSLSSHSQLQLQVFFIILCLEHWAGFMNFYWLYCYQSCQSVSM